MKSAPASTPRRLLPRVAAAAVGVVVGLGAAAAVAAPLGEVWRAHVLPAFAGLLGTLLYC